MEEFKCQCAHVKGDYIKITEHDLGEVWIDCFQGNFHCSVHLDEIDAQRLYEWLGKALGK